MSTRIELGDHKAMANEAKVGDRVLVVGGGTTQGLRWNLTVKHLTPTTVLLDNNLRISKRNGWPIPHGMNYAEIKVINRD